MTANIIFDSLEKGKWIRKISYLRELKFSNEDIICFKFDKSLDEKDIQPMHLVTFACLIEHFSYVSSIQLSSDNLEIANLIIGKLRYHEYFQGKLNHVESTEEHIFNLWRIIESEKDLYAKQVESYFERIMTNKDLSVISLNLMEAFYNIFDHANANGNAFSLIKFDTEKGILYASICDFGIGIARSVRNYCTAINDDREALQKAIQTNFTVRSKIHNSGKGLDNILSASTNVRIFCNNALLVKLNGLEPKILSTDFEFNGTLFYFEIDLNESEDVEIIDEFEL